MSSDVSATPGGALSQEMSEGVAVEIAQIWEQRKEAIVGRVDLLEEAVAGLLGGDLPQELRRTAEREAHKLAGSLGTFGLSRGSSLAREMEAIFERADDIAEPDVLRLSSLVTELRHELERPPARHPMPPRPPTASEPHPLLLVVGGGAELPERLSEEAGARAVRIRTASTLSGARRAIDEQLPQAVLLDLDVERDAQQSLALLRELTAHHPRLAVITYTARAGFEERVQTARLGARLLLEKPLTPARVFDAVLELFDELDKKVPKVLAVDDDLHVLAALRTLLESEGIELDTVDDPQKFWDVLSRAEPDLVVLDVDMTAINSIELCRAMRNDPRWRALPVLFLTKKTEPVKAREIFAAGADDYLEKPVVGAELAARIRGRLERLELYSRAADTDGLTGIASRAQSSRILERFIYLAERYRERFGIAVIDVDGLGRVNERHGRAAGDEVLRKLAGLMQQSFRGEDVAGRWSREEFVMGMYGLTREDGVQRMTELLARFRSREFSGRDGEVFHVTFSSGLAIFPDDARSLNGLYHCARDALHKAKQLGRNRLVAAGWRPDQPVALESADVVVVEDDETLAALLTHSLATQGYKVHRFQDGQEAAASLAATTPTLRAHLVLLDVDLPGLSGLDVLRQLARAGVLQKTRVIMLTARAAESEVLEAMELGAIDHVAKPFSVPILLQRVRRSMSR